MQFYIKHEFITPVISSVYVYFLLSLTKQFHETVYLEHCNRLIERSTFYMLSHFESITLLQLAFHFKSYVRSVVIRFYQLTVKFHFEQEILSFLTHGVCQTKRHGNNNKIINRFPSFFQFFSSIGYLYSISQFLLSVQPFFNYVGVCFKSNRLQLNTIILPIRSVYQISTTQLLGDTVFIGSSNYLVEF